MEVKAILFDMDGILMDSEYYYMHGTVQWMKELGYNKDEKALYTIIGTTMDQTYDMLSAFLDHRYTKDELKAINEDYFLVKHPLRPKDIMFDHVKEVLDKLKKMNIKLAVCSSSPKDTIVVSLSDMGIIDDFDIICCSENFEYPKPSPDIYLHAMDKLHVNKENTIVYEDSTIGIKAGVASGALCIAREDKRFNQDQSEAGMLVKDIVELLEFVEKENGRNIEN